MTLDPRPSLVFFLQVKKAERGLGTRLARYSLARFLDSLYLAYLAIASYPDPPPTEGRGYEANFATSK